MEENPVNIALSEDSKNCRSPILEDVLQTINTSDQKASKNKEYDSSDDYSDKEDKFVNKKLTDQSSDADESVILERESGDGQESLPIKKVDDDEDKKNPQYIPKRGTFYEHDDRTMDNDDSSKSPEVEKEKELKKKVWQDKREKWSHDRFIDTEQAPKSRAELVAVYGYDIRNEDGPPKARRRRRYGRGPNKYTRNWEDEDAYNKLSPRSKKNSKKLNRTEDFSSLNNKDNKEAHKNQNFQENNGELENLEVNKAEINHNIKSTPHVSSESLPYPQSPSQESYKTQQRVGSGRVVKPNREIKDSDYRGFTTKTRQVRNMKSDHQKVVTKADFIQTQNFTNKNNNLHEIEKGLTNLTVQDDIHQGAIKQSGQRQGCVPPRLQSEQKGSKRYSSIRQKSLPESATPPFNQQHTNFYSNEFNSGNQVNQQNIIHQTTQIHTSTTQVPQIAPPPLPPIPQVPVTATPILQAAPPQFAPPFAQAPPPFLQPAPPPFIPQQTTQIINYVPSQPQFPQSYQGFQQQFNSTQPEIYQPQTGITYYSTDQQVAQRSIPLKRPKAAIPIVAPPPIDLKIKTTKEDEALSHEDVSGTSGQFDSKINLEESDVLIGD